MGLSIQLCWRHTTLLKENLSLENWAKYSVFPKEIDVIVDEPLASQKHHPYAKYIFHYGKKIEGFPNSYPFHAGGIIISERPLYYHTALLQMPKGFPTTHFDMYGARSLRFHKYDILSQRGLGHIKDAIDWQSRKIKEKGNQYSPGRKNKKG